MVAIRAATGDTGPVFLLAALPVLPVLLLAALTAAGERRRGARATTCLVAGLFFPVTWVAWYVRDELRAPGHVPAR